MSERGQAGSGSGAPAGRGGAITWPRYRGTYRAAVVGHTGRGNYGHGLDLAFAGLPGVEVVAVADPDAAGRAGAQARTGAPRGYAAYGELLEREAPDLLAVGPRQPDQREAMLLAAIRAGVKAIYTEKPFARTLEEADRILAEAEARGVRIAVAHQNRAFPGPRLARRLVAEGRIGRLRALKAYGKQDRRGGGQDLMVLGTHMLDLMRFFSGDARWCHARVVDGGAEATPGAVREGEEAVGPVAGDDIWAGYGFDGGVSGSYESARAADGGSGSDYFRLELCGTGGTISIWSSATAPLYYCPRSFALPNHPEEWEAIPTDAVQGELIAAGGLPSASDGGGGDARGEPAAGGRPPGRAGGGAGAPLQRARRPGRAGDDHGRLLVAPPGPAGAPAPGRARPPPLHWQTPPETGETGAAGDRARPGRARPGGRAVSTPPARQGPGQPGQPGVEPLRSIHVGVGTRGASHLRAALESGYWRPVALVDVVPEYLAAARELTGLPESACYTRLEGALEAVPSDAVVVASPVTLHAAQIMSGLRAGRHVLTEKCFTVGLADAVACVEAAERHGRRLMVVQNARLSPPMRTLRRLVAEGTYGPLGLFTQTLLEGPRGALQPEPAHAPVAAGGARAGHPAGGAAAPGAPGLGAEHQPGLVRLAHPLHGAGGAGVRGGPLRDPPQHLQRPRRGVRDAPGVRRGGARRPRPHLGAHRGALGRACGGRRSETLPPDAPDTRGLEQHPAAREALADPQAAGRGLGRLIDMVIYRDFFEYVSAGREPESSGRRNLQTVRLLDAIQRSSEAGRPVEMEAQPDEAQPRRPRGGGESGDDPPAGGWRCPSLGARTPCSAGAGERSERSERRAHEAAGESREGKGRGALWPGPTASP